MYGIFLGMALSVSSYAVEIPNIKPGSSVHSHEQLKPCDTKQCPSRKETNYTGFTEYVVTPFKALDVGFGAARAVEDTLNETPQTCYNIFEGVCGPEVLEFLENAVKNGTIEITSSVIGSAATNAVRKGTSRFASKAYETVRKNLNKYSKNTLTIRKDTTIKARSVKTEHGNYSVEFNPVQKGVEMGVNAAFDFETQQTDFKSRLDRQVDKQFQDAHYPEYQVFPLDIYNPTLSDIVRLDSEMRTSQSADGEGRQQHQQSLNQFSTQQNHTKLADASYNEQVCRTDKAAAEYLSELEKMLARNGNSSSGDDSRFDRDLPHTQNNGNSSRSNSSGIAGNRGYDVRVYEKRSSDGRCERGYDVRSRNGKEKYSYRERGACDPKSNDKGSKNKSEKLDLKRR